MAEAISTETVSCPQRAKNPPRTGDPKDRRALLQTIRHQRPMYKNHLQSPRRSRPTQERRRKQR
eukprot:752002-Lingulodinium_polyedra.AAC.1